MNTRKIVHFLIIPALFYLNSSVSKAQVSSLITSVEELNIALVNAKPGDTLRLGDTEFSGKSLRINISGAEGNPVVIQSNHRAKTRFTVPLQISGDYVSVQGIKFAGNGHIEISGSGCRVSHCIFNDAKSGKWIRILPGSTKAEIDHNLFENKTNNREMDRNCQLLQIVVRNKNERHHIHHNVFRERQLWF